MTGNRVLIVDDDRRICGLLRRLAESQGYEAFAIDNPDLFKDSYLGFEPNLILLDLQMRGEDGIQLLNWLSEQRSSAPVVLMSGMCRNVVQTAQEIGKSLKLVMDHVYCKPIDTKSLAGLLRSYYRDPREDTRQSPLILRAEIEQAIDHNDICVLYQPTVELASWKTIGVEFLVRWRDNFDSVIFPEDFVRVAEEECLIAKLTAYVIEQGLRECAPLIESQSRLTLSINLSGRLLSDIQFPDWLERVARSHGIAPGRLTLEINAGITPDDVGLARQVVTRLRLKGFELCIDDFDLPASPFCRTCYKAFTKAKLARVLTSGHGSNEQLLVRLRNALALAGKLGLQTGAKGISSAESFDLLNKLGCHAGQGFHISYPLSATGLTAWIEEWESPSGRRAN